MRITTHVLDGTYGQSAAGVHAYLERASGNGWVTVCDVETDSEGCIEDWGSRQLERGLYRIVFDSDRYFATLGAITAYPEVVVIFRIPSESRAFQVQVTLSPYSYSTHFGATESDPEG
ncbi:MAG TPA: hydroxyisourate hydrolase [Streptosporangiaceae bacterium]